MPLLTVAVSGPPDPGCSATIAKTLTTLTTTHLGKDPSLTAVTIQHLEPDRWFVGAEALTGDATRGFWLRIGVTAGTNTKAQISGYIDAVFAAMADILGSVRSESYVIVDEIPAATWGYGGITQERRAVMRTRGAAAP